MPCLAQENQTQEAACTSIQRTRRPKRPGNSGAVCRQGSDDLHCQLLALEKVPSQQPHTKTPFYKGQMAAAYMLRKLLFYQITQWFIYVMCHCCRKNWCLSSFALLKLYAELLTPAKHS